METEYQTRSVNGQLEFFENFKDAYEYTVNNDIIKISWNTSDYKNRYRWIIVEKDRHPLSDFYETKSATYQKSEPFTKFFVHESLDSNIYMECIKIGKKEGYDENQITEMIKKKSTIEVIFFDEFYKYFC